MKMLLSLLVCLMGMAQAYAHDPYDASIRLLLGKSDLKATVILGWDAAKEALAGHGFSQEQVADLVRSRGPRVTVDLPVTVCAQLLVISREGKNLEAVGADLLNEGMEISFNIRYKRPAAGRWTVQAVLYDKIEKMRLGSFVAADEEGRDLGASVFTTAEKSAPLLVPESVAP